MESYDDEMPLSIRGRQKYICGWKVGIKFAMRQDHMSKFAWTFMYECKEIDENGKGWLCSNESNT